MHTLATIRPTVLRKLATLTLALTIISLVASDASAQFGRYRGRGGFGRGFYGRGYGGFYGRGYGGFYGPRVYNRGFVGPQVYSRGYGGFYGNPYARPFVAPPFYARPRMGFGFGYGFRRGFPY